MLIQRVSIVLISGYLQKHCVESFYMYLFILLYLEHSASFLHSSRYRDRTNYHVRTKVWNIIVVSQGGKKPVDSEPCLRSHLFTTHSPSYCIDEKRLI